MPDALVAATAELDPDTDPLLTGDEGIAQVEALACPVRLLAPDGSSSPDRGHGKG